MTTAQQQIIDSDSSLITVTAGPGSGKTTTLIARIVRLIKNGCMPAQIIAITFTNAAAREIEERLSKSLGAQTRLGYAGTLHGFLLRLLNQHGRLVGYRSGIVVLDDADTEAKIEQLMQAHRWKGTADALKKQIELGPFNAGRTKEEIIALDYYRGIKQSNAISFDGILFYGLELLKKIGGLPFQHLFVDEYQDSGELDAEIYATMNILNRMFIGDSDQSIFGFRGAKPEIMTAQMFSPKGFKAVLEDNFRCGSNICMWASNLISYNTDRFPKVTRSATGFNGNVWCREFDNAIAEMNWIAGEIDRSGRPLESFAILTRTNAQAGEIASFIESVGIRVARKSAKRFPNGFHQLIALLQFLSDPDNDTFAYKWVGLQQNKEAADKIAQSAAKAFTSINQMSYKFDPNISPVMAIFIASESGIHQESVSLLKQASRRLTESATISELACLLNLNLEDFSDESEQVGVTVCTLHKSKGREWENVYIPGFEQGLIPMTSKGSDLKEERRLAFVGITRAKHNLFLSHCKTRHLQWKGQEQRTPSQFIQELKVKNGTAIA